MKHNRLLVILVLGAILAVLAHLYGPAAQRRGMRAAGNFKKQIAPAVAADPRFSKLIIGISTHPALFVQGTVPDTDALHDLKQLLNVPDDAAFRLILNVTVAASTQPSSSWPS